MLRIIVAGVTALCALTLGVASATSLGEFAPPVATGLVQEVEPCTAASATALDGTIDLLDTLLLPTSKITSFELTGVAGDCAGLAPVVVVEGADSLGGAEKVLFVIEGFDPFLSDDPGTVSLVPGTHIALGDGIQVLSFVTGVRIAFCPDGATCD